jgi:TonB family protein
MLERLRQHPGLRKVGVLLAVWALLAIPSPAQDPPRLALPVSLPSRVAAALLVEGPPPEYPPLARMNFIQGRVRVRMLVSNEGRVAEAHILRGHPFLAMAALEAVQKWVYRPYRLGAQAVEFVTFVDFKFTLRSKKILQIPLTAERDLRARVTPPEIARRPADSPSADHVHLRVLVDTEGHAADVRGSGRASDVAQAERSLTQWSFQPAHWGTLPVPWYLDVDVPVSHWPQPTSGAGADPGTQ